MEILTCSVSFWTFSLIWKELKMSKQIAPKPALLIAQLQMMTAALTKYAEVYVPVSPSKADIEACTTELISALQMQVQTAGVAEKATKDLYAVRDRSMDLLRRMRDAVYAHFGKSDPRIVEFGLDTLKARRSKNGNGSEESSSASG
jgi:hypothetical protein